MKMLGRSSVVVVLLVAAVAAHAGAAGAAGAPVAPSAAETLGNQHANLRAAITSANAHSLRAAWLVRTPGPVSSTPIVWRGSLLFSDWRGWAWRVNALTGKVIWKRHLDTPDTTWPWYGLAGTGVVSGNVLVEVSADGYAWGLNAATGKPVWNKTYIGGDPTPNTVNPSDPYAKYVGNLSDLLAAGGRVFVGLSSCEEPFAESNPLFVPTARGSVIALDAATGDVDWQTWLVPTGDTGVPVWSSFALDPASTAQHPSGILYTDTGNNYTNPTTANSDAMLALDARTGELIWTTQLTPGDSWPTAGTDADFGAGPQLFTADSAGGTVLKLVGAMQKPGLYTALDRATGAIVWQTKLGNDQQSGRGERGPGPALRHRQRQAHVGPVPGRDRRRRDGHRQDAVATYLVECVHAGRRRLSLTRRLPHRRQRRRAEGVPGLERQAALVGQHAGALVGHFVAVGRRALSLRGDRPSEPPQPSLRRRGVSTSVTSADPATLPVGGPSIGAPTRGMALPS